VGEKEGGCVQNLRSWVDLRYLGPYEWLREICEQLYLGLPQPGKDSIALGHPPPRQKVDIDQLATPITPEPSCT